MFGVVYFKVHHSRRLLPPARSYVPSTLPVSSFVLCLEKWKLQQMQQLLDGIQIYLMEGFGMGQSKNSLWTRVDQ